MLHTDEIQKGTARIPFPVANVKVAQMRLDSGIIRVASDPERPGELNLSVSQVLVGCVSVLCTAGMLLWVLIKLWLFKP